MDLLTLTIARKYTDERVARNTDALETGIIDYGDGVNEISTTWVVGGINTSNGGNANMTTRLRSDYIPTDNGLIASVLGGNAEFCPVYYNASKQFISSPNAYQTADLQIGMGEESIAYVRLMIRNRTAANANLEVSYGDNISLTKNAKVKVFYTPEETEEAIAEIMQAGTFEEETNEVTATWVVGAIDTNKGIDNNTMNTRLRCGYISTANGLNVVVLGNNAEFCPVYFDKNKQFISSPGAYQTTALQVAPNTNTAFVRLMIRNKSATNSALTADYGNNIGLSTVNAVKTVKKIYYPADLSGKKIVFLGDSIPHGQSYAGNIPIPYPQVVANNLGMKLVNYGIGGSTIAQQTNYGGAFQSKTEFDYASKDTSKIYQVISGQSYTSYKYSNGAWVTDTGSYRTPITARYSFMDDDAEIVCVHCTTNDFQYNWTDLGTFEDTGVNTYYGALHTLIKGLMEKYEGKTIFFITPLKRAQDPYTTPTSANGKGKTLKDYRDILMEVCAFYGLPVIDAWGESGLNPHLDFQTDLWDSVLTHPLQKGHKLLGDFVASKILSIKRFVTP